MADAHAIPLLAVKGVVTGRTLYRDAAERIVTDVDVRVRPRDLKAYAAAGREAGWKHLNYSRAYRNVIFEIDDWMLDVETSIGPPGLCALGIDEIIARATVETTLFGFACRVPEVHDHALLLCVNVFKDKLAHAEARALRDVELVARSPEFRPKVMVERAERAQLRTMVWIVADWMDRTRGVRSWGVVRDGIGARCPRPAYAALFQRMMAGDQKALGLRVLARLAHDGWRGKLESVGRMGWWVMERRAVHRAATAKNSSATTAP